MKAWLIDIIKVLCFYKGAKLIKKNMFVNFESTDKTEIGRSSLIDVALEVLVMR